MPTPAEPLRAVFAVALATAALAFATSVGAQTIQGELIERDTGEPIPGAFVVLLDADGEQRAVALSDAAGRFLLTAPEPGSYSLGLDRIGYYSTRTDPIPLAEGQAIHFRLETIVAPVALEDIDVEVESDCRIRPEEGRAVARVWEEARKALNATAFTQQMGLLRYTVVGRERELDPYTFRVRGESERRRTGVTHGSPYVALPPAILARTGYARFQGEEQVYYGPDAATLLSDAFLDTHCLRLREASPAGEPHLIGVWFEPVRDHRLPDIRGTLWLDERTARLERLEYRYTNLPPTIAERGAGGEVRFERLDSGEWIVREWAIRMPVVRIPDEGPYSHLTMDPNERVATVIRIKEDSGEVVDIVPARGSAGARRVWAEAIDWKAGFAALNAVDRRRSAERVSTAGGRCPVGSVAPGRAAIVGAARDSVSGIALPGARVSVAWGSDPASEADGLADVEGRYVVCGVPTGVPLEVVGTFPGRTAEIGFSVPEGADHATLDLAFAGEAALESPRVRSVMVVRRDAVAGDASVAGTVADAATGEPLAGAQVVVEGTGTGAVTDGDGAFRFDGVAAGVRRLRVDYLGYESLSARVDVGSSGRTVVDARLVPSAIAVAALEVTLPAFGVEERRARGVSGWRLTDEDIPESLSMSLPELLDRRFAGVTYVRSSVTACPIIEARRGRIGLVILDGQPFRDTCVLEHVLPEDIASVEVLPGLAAGVTYGRAGGAGVIVIETKHGE